jgi:hypothetical protein
MAHHDSVGDQMSDHKFKIGQIVSYLGRGKASGTYKITQLMPSEGGDFFNTASEISTSRTNAPLKRKISKGPRDPRQD